MTKSLPLPRIRASTLHMSRTCPLPDTLLVVLSRRLLHAARLEGRTNASFNGFGVEWPRRGAALCTAQAPRMAVSTHNLQFGRSIVRSPC